MTDFYLGIDPGNTGAVAVLDSAGKLIDVIDMPLRVVSKTATVKKLPDPQGLLEALEGYAQLSCSAHIEYVSSAPGQGVATMFAFGRGLGVVEGVLAALRVPVQYVTPQRWKWHHRLSHQGKNESVETARKTIPESADVLTLKKHHGRAEAILIAKYGYDSREVFK